MIVELRIRPQIDARIVSRRPGRKKRLVLLWCALGCVALLIVAAAVFAANVPLSSDTLQKRIVETLSAKLDSASRFTQLQWMSNTLF